MNLKVTKNIQQLVAQRRAKRIETVRNEVITVNLKDARAKLAESTGAKQGDSPTTPTPVNPQDVAPVMDTTIEKSEAPPSPWAGFIPPTAVDIADVPVDPQDVAPVTDTIIEKSEATPQAPAPDTASLSPLGEDTTAPTPVAADVSSGTDLESVDVPTPPTAVDVTDVPVKKNKPTRSRSRSKSKAKK